MRDEKFKQAYLKFKRKQVKYFSAVEKLDNDDQQYSAIYNLNPNRELITAINEFAASVSTYMPTINQFFKAIEADLDKPLPKLIYKIADLGRNPSKSDTLFSKINLYEFFRLMTGFAKASAILINAIQTYDKANTQHQEYASPSPNDFWTAFASLQLISDDDKKQLAPKK